MPSLSTASVYAAAAQAAQGGGHGTSMVEAVNALNQASGGSVDALARALVANAKAGLEAVLLSLPRDGKVMVALAGQKLEVPLPADVQEHVAQNPSLLRPGTHIPVSIDPESQALRYAWPEMPASQSRSPATMVTLSSSSNSMAGAAAGAGQKPAAPAQPPAPSPVSAAMGGMPAPSSSSFPPGSAAYAISRLTGLSFPVAEAADALHPGRPASSAGARPAGASAPFSPAVLSALPQGIAQEALRAAMRQGPIGAAITQLLSSTPAPNAPEAVLVAQLAGLRLDGKAKPDGAKLRDAVRASGLFMEADLAAMTAEESAKGALPPDLKATLLTLKARMGEGASPASQAAQLDGMVETPAPLPRMIEGALERIKLMQMASLPDSSAGSTQSDAQPLRLVLSIPVATAGANQPMTAMLGLVVEHYPQGQPMAEDAVTGKAEQEAHVFPWKIRLAFDTAETGPVQAEIGLRGHAIAVTLWAENRRMAEGARADIASLHGALREAAFETITLSVKDGRPAGRAAPHFTHLDQRT